jgi:predicted component of type VI protein secretion system
MAITDKQIESVMAILTRWNPLGDRAESIADLDNYRTEAIDILAQLGMSWHGMSAAEVVQTVLNQAFDLCLTVEDCEQAAREINRVRQ